MEESPHARQRHRPLLPHIASAGKGERTAAWANRRHCSEVVAVATTAKIAIEPVARSGGKIEQRRRDLRRIDRARTRCSGAQTLRNRTQDLTRHDVDAEGERSPDEGARPGRNHLHRRGDNGHRVDERITADTPKIKRRSRCRREACLRILVRAEVLWKTASSTASEVR